MKRTLARSIMTTCLLATGFAVSAQDDVGSQIKLTLRQIDEAGARGDNATWAQFSTNDAIWINQSGAIQTKAQRMASRGGGQPPVSDGSFEVRSYGDAAVTIETVVNRDGTKARNARAWIKRDGRWQTMLFVATPVR